MNHTVIHFTTLPPSTNGLFFNRSGGGRGLTAAYRKWRTDAGWELKEQRPKQIKGRVSINLWLEDGHGDADNRLKSCLDLLVLHGVIEGDSCKHVRSITVAWDENQKGATVLIIPDVRPFTPINPAMNDHAHGEPS